jgi:hypothetical protein
MLLTVYHLVDERHIRALEHITLRCAYRRSAPAVPAWQLSRSYCLLARSLKGHTRNEALFASGNNFNAAFEKLRPLLDFRPFTCRKYLK